MQQEKEPWRRTCGHARMTRAAATEGMLACAGSIWPRCLLLLTVGATGLALCACASAPLTSTWTAPDVWSLNPKGKIIAVVFISRDESTRRDRENVLAKDLSARN